MSTPVEVRECWDPGRCCYCGEVREEVTIGPSFDQMLAGKAAEDFRKYFPTEQTESYALDPFQNPLRFRICRECIELLYANASTQDMLEQGGEFDALSDQCAPESLLKGLSAHIIGQEDARHDLALLLWKHVARLRLLLHPYLAESQYTDVEVKKTCAILLGPTGSGKTVLVQTGAKLLGLPFVTFDASSLTAPGYKGADVSDCIERLYFAAGKDLEKTEKGIVFFDEIDKLATSRGESNGVNLLQGAQNSLLRLIEGDKVAIKVGRHEDEKIIVDTTNILFIAAGVFPGLLEQKEKNYVKKQIGFADKKAKGTGNRDVYPEDLIRYGMLSELIGRFSVISVLHALSEDDLLRVLKEPKNALPVQYQALASAEGYKMTFPDCVLREVAKRASTLGTGARALSRIFEERFRGLLFYLPTLKDKPEHFLEEEGLLKGVEIERLPERELLVEQYIPRRIASM